MSDNIEDSGDITYLAPVVCDGCEGERNVLSFCLDCHGSLCNACKERHPNSRLTRNHKVLPRDHPTVIKARLAKTNRKVPCRMHPDNDYVTYCIKCNTPCCAKCMIEDHAGHDVRDFDDMEEDLRQALTKYGGNIEKEVLPQALKITTELKRRKSTSTEQLQKHKDQVRRRVSDLRKKVADLGKEAEDKLDEMYNTEVEILDDLIRTSEGKSKMMSELIANCKQTLDKANAVELSLLLSESPAEFATLLPKVILPPSTIISESSFEIHGYAEIIGEVKEDDQKKTVFDPVGSSIKLLKPEIKKELAAPDLVASASPPEPESSTPDMIQTSKEGEFSTSIEPWSMVRTEDNGVWIREGKRLALYMYDEAGNQKETVTMEFDINDITLTASQDIIATDYTNKRIVRISRSGDVTSLCSTSPLYPCGVCINDRQQLVVGFFKLMGEQPIKLVVYSSDGGSVLQEMEKDEDDKALFDGCIGRVRQNGNGDYVVVDGDTLVCLTRDGLLRWRHRGRSVWGVVCDRYCNVIYCDFYEGVTMLDRGGGLIRQLLTPEKDGVVEPRSVSLDRLGRLWIGLWRKTIQIWKYL